MNNQANINSSTISGTEAADISEALSTYNLANIRRYQKRTKISNLDHLPGDTGLPIIGHTYSFLTNWHPWMKQQYANYGPVFRMKTPQLETAILLGPEANRLVFQNENKVFSNFLAYDLTFRNLFDNNLLERDFADHKTQRKILQAAFKRPAIEGHMEIMNPILQERVQAIPSGRTIKGMDLVKNLLLDTGAKVFLGLEIGQETEAINQAFTDIVSATADPIRKRAIWFSPYAKGIRGNKFLCDFIMKKIPERRKTQGRDMFSQLCHLRDEDGNLLSDEAIRDHIIFVLFAAHDTTTSALSAILYSLASNQDWQDELRKEAHSINKDTIEFSDIEKLRKIGLTFKEALRMHPALAIMPRYALKEFEFNGHTIPANTVVCISSVFTHYMPEYWSNPEKFDPMRFSPERAEDKTDFFQYVPFGGGAHKCLGMHFADIQVKIFLCNLLKSYTVTKHPKMRKYKYNNIPLTFPTDGLPLRFNRL